MLGFRIKSLGFWDFAIYDVRFRALGLDVIKCLDFGVKSRPRT